MIEPEVSVVIPVYNPDLQLLGRAIDSVYSQDCNIELLIVDDGSDKVDVKSFVERSDKDISLFRQENAGPGPARNRGITEARGEFLAFLDQDDEWLLPSLLPRLRFLKEHPCSGGCLTVPLGSTSSDPWIVFDDLPMGGSQAISIGQFCDILRACGYFFIDGFLTRTSIVKEIGLLDEKVFGSDEMDLYLRIMRNRPLHFLQIPTYRRTLNSTCGNPTFHERMRFGGLELARNNRDWIVKHCSSNDKRAFWRLHDMLVRQCIKIHMKNQEWEAAGGLAEELIEKFQHKNLLAKVYTRLGNVLG